MEALREEQEKFKNEFPELDANVKSLLEADKQESDGSTAETED